MNRRQFLIGASASLVAVSVIFKSKILILSKPMVRSVRYQCDDGEGVCRSTEPDGAPLSWFLDGSDGIPISLKIFKKYHPEAVWEIEYV